MSKYKIVAISAIAAMSLLTGATASADTVIQGNFSPAQECRTSDPCTSDYKWPEVIQGEFSPAQERRTLPQVSENNFINYAPPGNRGTEGFNTELISEILKNIQFFKLNNFR
ncbi:hypothetical protein ACVRW4_06180 [Streptococcus phocae subsp. phocae]